ncbi:MAG: abortive infection family protein [Anaerolineae bacterium]|nr:abortive infection family protein [Anaerolineae bacterium]
MSQNDLILKVETLQNLLLARATGGTGDWEEYKSLREELTNHSLVKPLLPSFVITCRDVSQFWSFISSKYNTYRERREYIWQEFSPLLNQLESSLRSLPDKIISDTLNDFDTDHIKQIWERAIVRREEDPQGAITTARTLLESTCKTILDDLQINYASDIDLPKLYKLTAEQLNLAPAQHTEQIFKQILGGCQTVVEGLGAVRNKLGDAHGQGKKPVKPAARHAELAVNLAGAMSIFLVRTWEHKKSKSNQNE